MKKKLSAILSILMLCCGCSNNDFNNLKRNKDKIETYLSNLPDEYNELKKTNVIFDGTTLNDVSGSKGLFDKFYEDVKNNKETSAIFVQVTDEGDFIFNYINYDKNDFYILRDTRRDIFGNYGTIEYVGKYIAYFEDEKMNEMVISNIENLTYEQYLNTIYIDTQVADKLIFNAYIK